jgi:hypothetical protein
LLTEEEPETDQTVLVVEAAGRAEAHMVLVAVELVAPVAVVLVLVLELMAHTVALAVLVEQAEV